MVTTAPKTLEVENSARNSAKPKQVERKTSTEEMSPLASCVKLSKTLDVRPALPPPNPTAELEEGKHEASMEQENEF